MVPVNSVNNFATKIHIFWYLSMVENSMLLSGPIRLEEMHFAGMQTIKRWMENSHKHEAK